jgi:hypothetical protein
VLGVRKEQKTILNEIMSSNGTVVKQSTNDLKFKGSKPADAGTGSKKTKKIGFKW